MEMTFPLLKANADGARQRSDFRALLSCAISRQAISPTATAVTLAQRNLQVTISRDDSIESRARYFAGLHSSDQLAAVPHGAFFPAAVAETLRSVNYDQAVYHDGLVNGKLAGVEITMSDNLAIKTGAENRGHYD
jgi:hypothetical protein